MKVFFVKYNDPIYVKLEKLDIMIRLTNSSNIAQVLGELKEYATEVDVDFVRKSVRAIGRCAIKVEQAAEKCVSTLIELIQTKVNYVVQEAIVVIKDIFRKYPNRYENIISTLCENLDSLDEPEARASMIWIIGEYAERIDNADELLHSFLDGFQDENTQVQLQLLTAIVKLFLKKPTETQDLVQNVLTLTTQDTDNPDLRDRGYIYWRLLSTDAAAAKEVVLAEKPLISEETDLLEPTLLDELICHISSLASVYHKPPSAFVEGKVGIRRVLPPKSSSNGDAEEEEEVPKQASKSTVIPGGDLLDLDIGFTPQPTSNYNPTPVQSAAFDLLGDGLDSLIIGSSQPETVQNAQLASMSAPSPLPVFSNTNMGGLADIFSGLNMASSVGTATFAPPKQNWLSAQKGKGLEINGTFTRRNGVINMDMEFSNKALHPMTGFAIQLNKNSFGLMISNGLQIPVLQPSQTVPVTLALSTNGPILKASPINNLQIAVKNNLDVFYFGVNVPMHVYFVEDGEIDKKLFLNTWKEIPEQYETQYQLRAMQHLVNTDELCNKLRNNNVFTIAKRNVEGQDMLYQSMKLTNGIWILTELKVTPGNPSMTLSVKTKVPDVIATVKEAYEFILV
ncbi:AP-1 complex subunit beta-1 isoform X1 [Brachionus plicatilis]|uniref:AP-1 complex subunit beta-1 isoform X1 n=1 Tax=Brachionus plicatilis TaxID=10195 RepID=A0A3M7QXV7_BRAPC|nr:AP-1 complex subunit beta-1 isoform X1 [Brachionus plicatilis]